MTTMRPIRETIPLEEARGSADGGGRPIERTERVSLRDAEQPRARADDVVSATIDVPPFDRAAMDGYAVIAEDTFGAGRYEPEGASRASRRSTPARCRRSGSRRASASRSRPARRCPTAPTPS